MARRRKGAKMRLLRCYSRFLPPVIPAKAGIQTSATKLITRNQVQTAASGSLLPSWEKARMRVSPRASAALRAGRPRSQAAKPTPVSPSWERARARRASARLRRRDALAPRGRKPTPCKPIMEMGFAACARRLISGGYAVRRLVDSRFRGNDGAEVGEWRGGNGFPAPCKPVAAALSPNRPSRSALLSLRSRGGSCALSRLLSCRGGRRRR